MALLVFSSLSLTVKEPLRMFKRAFSSCVRIKSGIGYEPFFQEENELLKQVSASALAPIKSGDVTPRLGLPY